MEPKVRKGRDAVVEMADRVGGESSLEDGGWVGGTQ
jgi:hypothetical protein